jgi:hypothetical protein
MDVHGAFAMARLGKDLAGYLGLFETLDIKVDKLASSEFESGIRALEQASKSDKEKESLLRDARSRFNKSISLEKNEKLIMAYFGLGLCHYYLGDIENCNASFLSIKEVGLDLSLDDRQDEVLNVLVFEFPLNIAYFAYSKYRAKKKLNLKVRLNSCKLHADKFFNEFIANNVFFK